MSDTPISDFIADADGDGQGEGFFAEVGGLLSSAATAIAEAAPSPGVTQVAPAGGADEVPGFTPEQQGPGVTQVAPSEVAPGESPLPTELVAQQAAAQRRDESVVDDTEQGLLDDLGDGDGAELVNEEAAASTTDARDERVFDADGNELDPETTALVDAALAEVEAEERAELEAEEQFRLENGLDGSDPLPDDFGQDEEEAEPAPVAAAAPAPTRRAPAAEPAAEPVEEPAPVAAAPAAAPTEEPELREATEDDLAAFASSDLDRDGELDFRDPDLDGDGVLDVEDADRDNDGLRDEFDRDRDGDGFLDESENATATERPDGDTNLEFDRDPGPRRAFAEDVTAFLGSDKDSDGELDAVDPDQDGDGTLNLADEDDDNDGVADLEDLDADGDGFVDSTERFRAIKDFAGDTAVLPDDGQQPARAAQPTDLAAFARSDRDGDGVLDFEDPDLDDDGIANAVDRDRDDDGVDDRRDLDRDNDGFLDSTENADVSVQEDGSRLVLPKDLDDDDFSPGLLENGFRPVVLDPPAARAFARAAELLQVDDVEDDFGSGTAAAAADVRPADVTTGRAAALSDLDGDKRVDLNDRDLDNDGILNVDDADRDNDGIVDTEDLDVDGDGFEDASEPQAFLDFSAANPD